MYVDEILNRRNSLRLLFAEPVRSVFDSEDPPADDKGGSSDDPPPTPASGDKSKKKPVLTTEQQEFVNSLLAEERRKSKAATDRVITQLETLKNQHGTTAAEKEALEQRIEELKNTQLTQEELRKKDEAKRAKKHQEELEAATKERDHWKNLFTNTTITREITQAAATAKAYNPKHVVNELAPYTRLVDELDDEGKPTGQLVPKVRLTIQKDGKQAAMDMTVTEAVKWMAEQDEHAPLFNSGATGGTGLNPNDPSRRGRNADSPPDDPAEYVAWRKKNRGRSGSPRQ